MVKKKNKKKPVMHIGLHGRPGLYHVHYAKKITGNAYNRNAKKFKKYNTAVKYTKSLKNKYSKQGYKIDYTNLRY